MDLQYKTKCRGCGKIETWAWTAHGDAWQTLNTFVFTHLAIPIVGPCAKCKELTLKDIVSYSEKPK